jgi:hypothetical protein
MANERNEREKSGFFNTEFFSAINLLLYLICALGVPQKPFLEINRTHMTIFFFSTFSHLFAGKSNDLSKD